VHGTQLCDEILRLIDDSLCGPDINRREGCQTGDSRNGRSLRPLRQRKAKSTRDRSRDRSTGGAGAEPSLIRTPDFIRSCHAAQLLGR
jgi:hypothetical protein